MMAFLAQDDIPQPPDFESEFEAAEPFVASVMSVLNTYSILFIVAFIVTLFATPLVRRIAVSAGIVDHPDLKRKSHREPVAYLGGVAVFLGVLVAIGFSYLEVGGAQSIYRPIPLSIIIGIFAITITGLADDVWGWDPRLKIAGQLVAAAALAIEDVGVRVAEGVLRPLFGDAESALIALDFVQLTSGDVYYWVGTALIAVFVLGGCNAANLIDGLDGLLSGTVAIVAIGLLAIAILIAVDPAQAPAHGLSIAGAQIALCFAVLGAVLGFLPHNFNPASIFLGDCGSLLLGYLCVVIILMLGDQGQTHLVFAGLIIFALPIMDTTLAIVRRKLSGRSMSAADSQHIHHQLLRALGGVKRAVLALYGISIVFAVVGVTLAMLVTQTQLRVRVIYAIAFVLFGFIGVMAFKAGRRAEFRARQERANRVASAGEDEDATVQPTNQKSSSAAT